MPKTATACPVSREQFLEKAQPIDVKVGGTNVVLVPREFSSGSLGWYAGQKVVVEVGGVRVTCQLGLNLTVIGSKPGQ